MAGPANSAAPSAAPVAPEMGTPEYDTAMAAVGDRVAIQAVSADGRQVAPVTSSSPPPEVAPPAAPGGPERPSWLPEKFKSAEDMAKAYSELEKMRGKAPAATPAEPPAGDLNVTPPDAPPETPPGVDTAKFFEEFAQAGALSEASYADLAKAGLGKDVVDAYIAGQTALADQRTQAGYAVVGGEAQFKQMTEWAKSNLTPGEISAYNSQVNSPSVDAATLALQGLQAKFQAATGRNPANLLNGSANPAAATNGYQSRAQVTAAMRDARYDTDPAYRASVMDRLRVTADSVI